MGDKIEIGEGSATPPEGNHILKDLGLLGKLIDDYYYNGLGAPIYIKRTGPTRISEIRNPGEDFTEVLKTTPSAKEIIGIILSIDGDLDNPGSRYLMLGKDGSAIVFSNIVLANQIKREYFTAEGEGLRIGIIDQNRLITDFVLTYHGSSFDVLADIRRNPENIIELLEKAVEQAKKRKTEADQNLNTTMPKVIDRLSSLFPQSTEED